MEVSTDPDHKFDLAISLDDLDTALSLARASPHLGSQSKWRTVGDRALASWKIGLAEECFKMAQDWSALLLIYTSTGDQEGLKKLGEAAGESARFVGEPGSCDADRHSPSSSTQRAPAAAAGLNNIAFASTLQLSSPTPCVDLLLSTDRAPEAALFARTFAPSQTSKAVQGWRKMLEGQKKGKIASGLADPAEHVEEFGGRSEWEEALERERRGHVEEPSYEEEQEQFEEEPQQEQEQYEHQHQQEQEHDLLGDDDDEGVEHGVAGLHLGAEQTGQEEEQAYVPHEAQEGLRELTERTGLGPRGSVEADAVSCSRTDTRSLLLHQRGSGGAGGPSRVEESRSPSWREETGVGGTLARCIAKEFL